MSIVSDVLGNGIFVVFLALVVGMAVGRVTVRGVSFGVAGPLFAGLVLGHLGLTVPPSYSGLALALFVACVGLIAAEDISGVIRTYGPYFVVLAAVMTASGFAVTALSATVLFPETNTPLLMGAFTGALTSSPGLASALDGLSGSAQASYQIGHSIGYVVGAVLIVLFQQLYPRFAGLEMDAERRRYEADVDGAESGSDDSPIERVSFSLVGFGLVLAVGVVLGSIPLPLGPLGAPTLGTTGGVIIAALVLGYYGELGPVTLRMDRTILSELRSLTLGLFLATVGIEAGSGLVQTVAEYGVQIVLASALTSLTAILVGLAVTRRLWGQDWITAAGGICGGHTDTKGLAAAIDATDADEVGAAYGNTYPFALLFMVLYAKVLVLLVPATVG
ncbi:aspartate-alanine antiporter-like transporter [Natrialba aegyptia]|uniref:YidE/YbjL duplication domain-containing protein n=1 Tax=Natrialba aegyptia DSM 13077 TaxID=1227491 RepID=M0BAE4_9EURY|nr:hypothetical protein [Natrialba aegyptia]ELZ07795.1 hypothetical protein C480_03039 [Natrialba aegyptia DSM 13077]